ncbi:MAG: aminotransferase class I/II-fold pyridoxal phosphate-dependent enzyme [Catenulispora sp.]|nr:aminotransferase class I/II-fold pyridoxal phosphate-dependent enzyme [Catenulispora sp.]
MERLPEFFHEVRQRSQLDLEHEFVLAFLALAGEPAVADSRRHMLSYSASCAITMVASHCARFGRRVGLIEPVFDNISSILMREGVMLTPLRESEFAARGAAEAVAASECEVVWLVSPNNPTGWTLSESEFGAIVADCAARGRLLVLDTSFRFFHRELQPWSMYEMLETSGVSYVVLEDTGKTWSTNEIKVGLVICSQDMYPEMFRLHDDLLQAVSPLHLRMLIEFIQDSRDRGRAATVLRYVTENRAILRAELAGTPLTFLTGPDSPVSVDWLRIDADFDAEDLYRALAEEGVHILAGGNFYWSTPSLGDRLVRIALSRDPADVRLGAEVLRATAFRLAQTAERPLLGAVAVE